MKQKRVAMDKQVSYLKWSIGPYDFERGGDVILGAVDLITNNGDVAAGVMLWGGFKREETGEN